MCPQPPKLSPEYSHKAGLQTVITGMPLQIRPVTRGGHAGPVTMGRIPRGPLSWTRPHGGMTPSQAFVWCRMKRRVSLPVLSSSDRRLQRGHRAKGGVFAFAPTVCAATLVLTRRQRLDWMLWSGRRLWTILIKFCRLNLWHNICVIRVQLELRPPSWIHPERMLPFPTYSICWFLMHRCDMWRVCFPFRPFQVRILLRTCTT
jgi:hypothetical protein